MIRPMIATVLVACLSIAAQAQQRPAAQDLEGWANVPGGTVWLRPGVDSYEHSTGLVRDMRTGQKYYPVTPQHASQLYVVEPPYTQPAMQQPCQQQPCQPQVIVTPVPAPQVIMPQVVAPHIAPRYPAQQPTRYLPNPYYSPSFTPQARPTRNSSRYDYGPYGEYADSGLEATPPARSLSNQFGTLRRF